MGVGMLGGQRQGLGQSGFGSRKKGSTIIGKKVECQRSDNLFWVVQRERLFDGIRKAGVPEG
jgi:hypothetical protein